MHDNNNNSKRQKLTLNKETLRVLSSSELQHVNGGEELNFTYSLSLGARCRKSAGFTNGTTCRCADRL